MTKDPYNRSEEFEMKFWAFGFFAAILLIIGQACFGQENLTNDQFYKLVTINFENNARKFNYLFNKVDSLEVRIKKLENPIPCDSVFDRNALIELMEKPDTIWPGLWRPGVDWKKVREKLFRP